MASIYMSRSRQTSVVLQQSLTRPLHILRFRGIEFTGFRGLGFREIRSLQS